MVAVTQTGQKEILLFGAAASSATIGALSAGERNKKYYKMQIRIQLDQTRLNYPLDPRDVTKQCSSHPVTLGSFNSVLLSVFVAHKSSF